MTKGKFVCGYRGCTEVISSRQKNRHFEDVHKMDLLAMTPEELEDIKRKCVKSIPVEDYESPKYVNPILEHGMEPKPRKYDLVAKTKKMLSSKLDIARRNGWITVDVEKVVQSKNRIVTIEDGCIVVRVPMLTE